MSETFRANVLNRQGSSERERDSAGVGGDTVMNNAVNYSDSGAREGYEIIPNKGSRKEAKNPTNIFASRDAVQPCKKSQTCLCV